MTDVLTPGEVAAIRDNAISEQLDARRVALWEPVVHLCDSYVALREQLRVEQLNYGRWQTAKLEIRRLTDALREADCLLKYSRFRRGKAAYKIVRSALAEMGER